MIRKGVVHQKCLCYMIICTIRKSLVNIYTLFLLNTHALSFSTLDTSMKHPFSQATYIRILFVRLDVVVLDGAVVVAVVVGPKFFV